MPNLIDFYYQNKQYNGLAFSLCLSNIEGGFLNFGGDNSLNHLPGKKTYTVPISRESGQYNIHVYSMSVKNKFIIK